MKNKKESNEFYNYHNNFKTDYDLLKENFQFIWEDEAEVVNKQEKFAREYYDRLFKEYCIADLTHYKSGKIGLRWCNEKDLIQGKGKNICGNSSCESNQELTAYEVNMNYVEKEESKNALVKVYLCRKCGKRLRKMNKIRRKKEKKKIKDS